MNRILAICASLLIAVHCFSQTGEIKPITAKQLQTPNNVTFYFNVGDTTFWASMGQYGQMSFASKKFLERYYVPYDGALRNVNLGDRKITSTKQRLPLFNGACVIPTILDNGDGSITVGNGEYHLSTSTDGKGTESFVITGGIFSLTDNTTNYLVADYNSGTPILKVITDVNLINETTVVPVYTAYRNGTALHFQDWDALGVALANKVHQSIVKTQRYRRESGLGISEVATRYLSVGNGRVWVGAVPVSVDAVITSTDNLRLFYHSGGVWTVSIQTQYNNTQYDNGTNLVALTANRYAVNWIFRGIESQKHLYVVLGRGDYTLAQAQEAILPAIPTAISSHAMLIGKLIVQNGATTATSIQSAFDTQFSTATPNAHNDLTGRDVSDVHPAGSITVTPSGTISSTTVAAALTELDAEKEPLLTKGNLNENITGLEFSSTRQVIGGTTTLTVSTGYVIPTTDNISHAETAYTHSQNDADLSITNEGQLSTVGTTNNATIQSNTSGSNVLNIKGAGINVASASGNNITITGTEVDGSTSNELQTLSTSSSGTTRTITISSGNSVSIDIADNDNSTTNELNSAMTWTDATNIIGVTDAGGSKTVEITGFEGTLTKGNLTAGSNKVAIGGTGTGALIGTGASVDVNEANLTLSNIGGSVTDSQVPNTITLDNITQITNRSHTNLSNIGVNTHAQIDTHITNDGDLSANNEIQAPTLVGNLVGLTQTSTTIDISTSTAVVAATTHISNDADLSATNEIQNISTNGNPGNITISSGSTLNLNVNDADASTTNEIQDLSGSGATLSGYQISLSEDASPVTLPNEADGNTTNEIQAPTRVGDLIGLTQTTTTISIADKLPTANINGTSGYLSKFTGINSIGNSQIFDDGGNVGIFTNSPTSKFQLVTGIGDGIAWKFSGSYGNSSIYNIWDSGSDSGNKMQFKINSALGSSSTVATMLGNGFFGVGTESPNATIEIKNRNANANPVLRINSGLAGGNYIDFNPFVSGVSNDGFEFKINDINVITIQNGGNVGIGYSTGTEITNNKLAVNGSGYFNGGLTTKSVVGYENITTGGDNFLRFTSGNSFLNFGYNDNLGEFHAINGSVKMIVFNSGNVNISTSDITDHGYKLYVNGNINSTSTINSTGYLLNGNNLFSSLSPNYLPYWDGGKLVNSPIKLAGNGIGINTGSNFSNYGININQVGGGMGIMVGDIDTPTNPIDIYIRTTGTQSSKIYTNGSPLSLGIQSEQNITINQDRTISLSSLVSTNARLLSASSTGQLTPITNASGFLKNDGSGNFSYWNPSVQSLSGTTTTWTTTSGVNAKITITAATTIYMTGLVSGQTGNITITNPSTAYKLKFTGYTLKISPALTADSGGILLSGSSKTDVLSWYYDGDYVIINGTLSYQSFSY